MAAHCDLACAGISELWSAYIDGEYSAGDYMYKLDAIDDLWVGNWGIIRAYDSAAEAGLMKELPATSRRDAPQISSMKVREYWVEAVSETIQVPPPPLLSLAPTSPLPFGSLADLSPRWPPVISCTLASSGAAFKNGCNDHHRTGRRVATGDAPCCIGQQVLPEVAPSGGSNMMGRCVGDVCQPSHSHPLKMRFPVRG